MKLLIRFQISTVHSLKFGNGQVISPHTFLRMWLFIHAEIKLNHVSERGPRRHSDCDCVGQLLSLEFVSSGHAITVTSQWARWRLKSIVYLAVWSGANQRKQQSSASLAFVRGIRRWPVNSQHKGPVTRKMFPFDDVIMQWFSCLFGFFCVLFWCSFTQKDRLINRTCKNHQPINGHEKQGTVKPLV